MVLRDMMRRESKNSWLGHAAHVTPDYVTQDHVMNHHVTRHQRSTLPPAARIFAARACR